MINRRTRHLALAALALAGGVIPIAATAQPAAATTFVGLDCGVEGTATSLNGSLYKVVGVASAGPFDSGGKDAVLSCELRKNGPSGTVMATWGSAGSFGIAPPYAGTLIFDGPSPASTFYVCSRLSWVTPNGPESAGGCEETGVQVVDSSYVYGEVWVLAKPQDADLDSNWP